jgi:hypothetical protein
MACWYPTRSANVSALPTPVGAAARENASSPAVAGGVAIPDTHAMPAKKRRAIKPRLLTAGRRIKIKISVIRVVSYDRRETLTRREANRLAPEGAGSAAGRVQQCICRPGREGARHGH